MDQYFSGERFGVGSTLSPSFYMCSEQRNEVIAGSNIDIVAHHGGYVGFKEQRYPIGMRLLEHRAKNLVRYIQESSDLLAQGKVEQCLIGAFESMDKDLKAIVEEEGCPLFTTSAEALWSSRYNSLVVVVDKKHKRVHVAGSGQLHVLVVKPGDDTKTSTLTTDAHNAVAEYNRQLLHRPDTVAVDVRGIATRWTENEDGTRYRAPRKIDRHDQLFFYKQVELEEDHDHVMLATDSYVDRRLYFLTDMFGYISIPITDLPDYFDTVGFETVIRSVVYECPQADRAPVLLVLCLDHHKHSGLKRGVSALNTGAVCDKRLKFSQECDDVQLDEY